MKKKITHEQFQQLLMIAGIIPEDAIMLTQIDILLDQRIEALSKEYYALTKNQQYTASTSAFISQAICIKLKDSLLDLIKEYIQYG